VIWSGSRNFYYSNRSLFVVVVELWFPFCFFSHGNKFLMLLLTAAACTCFAGTGSFLFPADLVSVWITPKKTDFWLNISLFLLPKKSEAEAEKRETQKRLRSAGNFLAVASLGSGVKTEENLARREAICGLFN
jgi:hypothetical protein